MYINRHDASLNSSRPLSPRLSSNGQSMFKKPTQDLKTSGWFIPSVCSWMLSAYTAPLRNSDRKKFRQKVLQQFSIAPRIEAAAEANSESKGEKEPDIGDILVPDGILSVKFRSHLDEPGVRPVHSSAASTH